LYFAHRLNFLKDATFRKLTVLQSSGKEALNLGEPLRSSYSQSLSTIETQSLLGCVPKTGQVLAS